MSEIKQDFLISFDNNSYLPVLYGFQDKNIKFIEKLLNISLFVKGNLIYSISGEEKHIDIAKQVLSIMYKDIKIRKIKEFNDFEIKNLVHSYLFSSLEREEYEDIEKFHILTPKLTVMSRSKNQLKYIKALFKDDMIFSIGPSGSGKTYLAVVFAVSMLLLGKYKKIILSRPVVEAGEKLGFLPGDLKDKIDPYLLPLYDILREVLSQEQVERKLKTGEIEIAPLAFMRGRTLEKSFVILDEAQNTSFGQMKMFLTRLGLGSKMVITGDITQIDLPKIDHSGLWKIDKILKGIKKISFCYLENQDIVRHPLIKEIIKAYEKSSL